MQLPACVVVRHRAVGAAGAQVRPGTLFAGSMVRRMSESSALGAMSESRANMPPGADRGELCGVADRDELCPGALDDAVSRLEAVGVGHAGLVEVDRRVGADVERPCSTRAMSASTVKVLPASAGTVVAEALRGRPGHRDAEGLAAGVLLGAGGGVDHDALAGAGRSDEDRGALGAGDDLQRVCLLGAEVSADPLGDLVARDRAGLAANVSAAPAARMVNLCSIACSRARTRERRHQPAFQGEDAAFGDHRP